MNSTIYQIKLQIIYLYHSIARSVHMNGHLEGLRQFAHMSVTWKVYNFHTLKFRTVYYNISSFDRVAFNECCTAVITKMQINTAAKLAKFNARFDVWKKKESLSSLHPSVRKLTASPAPTNKKDGSRRKLLLKMLF